MSRSAIGNSYATKVELRDDEMLVYGTGSAHAYALVTMLPSFAAGSCQSHQRVDRHDPLARASHEQRIDFGFGNVQIFNTGKL